MHSDSVMSCTLSEFPSDEGIAAGLLLPPSLSCRQASNMGSQNDDITTVPPVLPLLEPFLRYSEQPVAWMESWSLGSPM